MIRLTILAVSLLAAAYAGAHYRESQIQATCESDSAPTIINGTTYLCLSAQQIDKIRKSHRQET